MCFYSTGISQEAYRAAVRDDIEIDWHCAACAALESSEREDDLMVPDSPPTSPPLPASVSPTAPAPPSSPLQASPAPTAASPISDISLEDPDPAQVEVQPYQLTFSVVDDATLKRKRKLVDNDGYTYNVKRQCVNTTHWQCTVRPKVYIAYLEQLTLLLNVHLIRFSSFFFVLLD